MPAFYEAESVPYFVVEVSALFAQGVIKEYVVAGRGREHHTHTHAVGTVTVDEIDRVGRVAERFGHLTAYFIAHDTGKVNVLEWHLALVFISGHNHTGYPEEDDVGAGNKVGRGVVVTNLFVAGVVDAVEKRDGPQPR